VAQKRPTAVQAAPAPHVKAALSAVRASAPAVSGPSLRPAARTTAGNAVQRAPAQQAGVLQRKMGMELEIPVVFVTDQGENVATKMSYIENDYYKIEGDKSGVAGQMKGQVEAEGGMKEVTYNPTILELVTHPFDEHAPDGLDKFIKMMEAVELFRAHLYGATKGYKEPTTLGVLAKLLRLPLRDEYKDYLINVPTATPRTKEPDTAYAHFTVGLTLDAVPRAAEWLMGQSIDEYPGIKTHKDVQGVMTALDKYLERTWEDFQSEEEFFPDPVHGRQITSFVYLAATHVQAIERHQNDRVEGGGCAKNYTPVLSRASFHNMAANLSPSAKKYLAKHRGEIHKLVSDQLLPIDPKAIAYLRDIFTGSINTQREYFGGMVVKPVERTGVVDSGLSGPPVEIRGLGTDLKEEGLRETAGILFSASRGQFLVARPTSPIKKDSLFVERV
jgi:hypothetical protein